MNAAGLKHRLRELKRVERKIRFGDAQGKALPLVWDLFFDLRDAGAVQAKYPLQVLAAMDRETLRLVIGEYWSYVCRELFHETDIPGGVKYDAGVLLQWGLPADAGAAAVKRKFRELAKLYHPDAGGDEQSFIALMEAYRQLTGK